MKRVLSPDSSAFAATPPLNANQQLLPSAMVDYVTSDTKPIISQHTLASKPKHLAGTPAKGNAKTIASVKAEPDVHEIFDIKPAFPSSTKAAKASPGKGNGRKVNTTGTESNGKGSTNGKGNANGTWTAEIRARFMDEIIAAGYKTTNLDKLADELGMNKRQLINQLVPNVHTNLRAKAVQAVSGGVKKD